MIWDRKKRKEIPRASLQTARSPKGSTTDQQRKSLRERKTKNLVAGPRDPRGDRPRGNEDLVKGKEIKKHLYTGRADQAIPEGIDRGPVIRNFSKADRIETTSPTFPSAPKLAPPPNHGT
jgi:hypothetical protein